MSTSDIPYQVICAEGLHLIQKNLDGSYGCVQCGQVFREHHELVIVVGSQAQQRG